MRRRLPSFSMCYCCGEENEKGLKIPFYVDGDEVVTTVVSMKDYCGYPGILHGGVTATLLDEAMTWAVTVSEKRFHYAGEVTVRYRAPIPAGEEVTIRAQSVNKVKKWVIARGCIMNKKNEILAKSEGKYFPLSDGDDENIRQRIKKYDNGFNL